MVRDLWLYLPPPPETFSFQLPPVLRVSVMCVCSFPLFFLYVSFYLVHKLKFLVNMQIICNCKSVHLIIGIKVLHMEQHKTWQH